MADAPAPVRHSGVAAPVVTVDRAPGLYDHAAVLGERFARQSLQVLAGPPGGRAADALSLVAGLFGGSGLRGWKLQPSSEAPSLPDGVEPPDRYVPADPDLRIDPSRLGSLAAARVDPAVLAALGAVAARLPERLPDGESLDGPARAAVDRLAAGLPVSGDQAAAFGRVALAAGFAVLERPSVFELPLQDGSPTAVHLDPGEPVPASVDVLALQAVALPRVEMAHRVRLAQMSGMATRDQSAWCALRADAIDDPVVLDRLDAYDAAVASERAAVGGMVARGPVLPDPEPLEAGVPGPRDGVAVGDDQRARRDRLDRLQIGRETGGPSVGRYLPFVPDDADPADAAIEDELRSLEQEEKDHDQDLADAEYDARLVDPALDSDPHAVTASPARATEHRFAVRGRPPEGPDDAERRAAFLARRAEAVVGPFVAAARSAARSGEPTPAVRLEAAVFEMTGTSAHRPTGWTSQHDPEAGLVLKPARPLEFGSALASSWQHVGADPALLAAGVPDGLEWRADDAGVVDLSRQLPGEGIAEPYQLHVPTPSLRFGTKVLDRDAQSPPEPCVEHAYLQHVLLPQAERGHLQLCLSDPGEAAQRERRWARDASAFDPEVADRVFDYSAGAREQRERTRFVSRAAALMGARPGQFLDSAQHARIDSCGPSLAASLPVLAPDLPVPASLREHPGRLEAVLVAAADRLIASPDDPLLTQSGDRVAAAVFDAVTVTQERLAARARPVPQPPSRAPVAVPPAAPSIGELGPHDVPRMGAALDSRLVRQIGDRSERLQEYLGDMVDVARADGIPLAVRDECPAGADLAVPSDACLKALPARERTEAVVAGIRTVADALVERDTRIGANAGRPALRSGGIVSDLIVHAAVTHGCAREDPMAIGNLPDVRVSARQFRTALQNLATQSGRPGAADTGSSEGAEPGRSPADARAAVVSCFKSQRLGSLAAMDWVLDQAARIGDRFGRAAAHVSLVRNPAGSLGRFPDGRRVPAAPLLAGAAPARPELSHAPSTAGATRPSLAIPGRSVAPYAERSDPAPSR